MNTHSDPLSKALHCWTVKPPVDANFRNAVWQRIGRRSQESWSVYLRSHATTWVAVTVLMLGVAAFTGRSTAHARVRADRDALIATYLADLDPRVQAAQGH